MKITRRDHLERLDRKALRVAVRMVRLRPERVRSQLRAAGRPFLDPGGPPIKPDQLHETARWVVSQAAHRRALGGAIADLIGAPSLLGRAIGEGLHALRLAQRLLVVYGFDLGTDRGRVALWRALAAALQVDLPDQGPLTGRLSAVLDPTSRDLPARLARALLRDALRRVLTSRSRWLPAVGWVRARHHRRAHTEAMGARMIDVLERLAEPVPWVSSTTAEEVPPHRSP